MLLQIVATAFFFFFCIIGIVDVSLVFNIVLIEFVGCLEGLYAVIVEQTTNTRIIIGRAPLNIAWDKTYRCVKERGE